jgi:hypothetical protein
MENHSHSIVLIYGNALTRQRKFFLHTVENRLYDPSEICALDFKREFLRSAICSVSATVGIDRSIFGSRRNDPLSVQRRKNTVSANGTRPFCDAGRAPLRQREISFSQGAEWKALISRYIGTIPLSGDAPCAAEQSIFDMLPPSTPASSAMIAKVGAAARDSKQSALALGRSRRCPTSGSTKLVVLEIISPHPLCSIAHGTPSAIPRARRSDAA